MKPLGSVGVIYYAVSGGEMPTTGNVLLLAGLLLSAGCANGSARVASDPIRPSPLRASLEPCDIPRLGTDALCGSYEVWEDRQARIGRKIALNIVVVPAESAEPQPDALFFLHGGPGAAATWMTANIVRALPEIHRSRDIVFVDQRGTGDSAPLECDLAGRSGIVEFMADPEAVAQCREALEEKADLSLYTTPIAMDDLDEVRDALGYAKIDLYGGSYGSRAALIYLRRHPDHVRSAVLRGVAPPAIRLPLYMARDAQRALDIVFADCERDPSCHAAFPEGKGEFRRLVASLPDRNQPDGTPSREFFVTITRLFLYEMGTSRRIPWIVHHAARGDFQPFHDTRKNSGGIFNVRLSIGMLLSVVCAEDVPFFTPEEADRLAQGTFLGAGRAQSSLRTCSRWVRGDIGPEYHQPVRSDAPVLLISGERDPVTPPSWADGVARHLPNSRHVVVPSMGHTGGSRCVNRILQSFVLNPEPDAVDDACVSAIRMPDFVTE